MFNKFQIDDDVTMPLFFSTLSAGNEKFNSLQLKFLCKENLSNNRIPSNAEISSCKCVAKHTKVRKLK